MRYYGGKTKLLEFIQSVVDDLNLPPASLFFDIFSGTGVVGAHFKKAGFTVYSNDFLEFSHALAKTLIEVNRNPAFSKLNVGDPIEYLNNIDGTSGFITKNYSPHRNNERQYVSVSNAKKIDAIREQIHTWKERSLISEREYYFLITSLLRAINLVSNVTGTYAAYLKSWDNRALKEMHLEKPEIISSTTKNRAFRSDANDIVSKYPVDVLYLDPPYNSRQYASNYFFLELIAEGWFEELPEIYGVTGMRPYEHQKSDYCSVSKAVDALEDLVDKASTKYILMSYNDEGIIPHEEIMRIFSKRGTVKEYSMDHKRYRAINQDGSHIRTNEHLFLLNLKK